MFTIVMLAATLVMQPGPNGMQVSITDYGAKADNITDSTPAFNLAMQALRELHKGGVIDPNKRIESRILVPGGPASYIINKPIMISDNNVRIVGTGQDSQILNTGSGPCFIFGVRGTETINGMTVGLTDANVPARQGLMDASFATGTGRRTLGNSIIGFVGTAFDLGPGSRRWEGVSTLTIDMAIINNNGWPGGKVEGLVWCEPLQIQVGGGIGQLDLHVKDSNGNIGTASMFIPAVDIGGGKQLERLTFQIDLSHKTVTGWVNRKQVAVTVAGNAFAPVGSGQFARNRYSLFLLGADTQVCDGRFPVGVAVPAGGMVTPDITFMGLNASAYLKYKVGKIGDSQESIGGTVVNDSYAYGVGDGYKALAMLWGIGEDAISDTANGNGRKVSMFSPTEGFRIAYGFQINVNQSSVLGGQSNNGIQDIQLSTITSTSPVVQTFGLLDFSAKNVAFRGGTQGFSTIPGGASYTIHLDSCRFSNSDTNIYGAWSIMEIDNAHFESMPATAINTWGSSVRLTKAFCSFPTPNSRNFAVAYGDQYAGYHRYNDVTIDYEGEVFKDCAVNITQAASTTTLITRGWYTGSSVKGIPFVRSTATSKLIPFRITIRDIDTLGGLPSMLLQNSGVALSYSEAQSN